MSENKFIEFNSQGYVNINKEFLFDTHLNNTDKTLYIMLQSACWGVKDSCFPSRKTLVQAINRSVWNYKDQRSYDFDDLEKKLLGWK